MAKHVDVSAYLVLGPENTRARPVPDIVAQALDGGFTCIQIRSKECSARELIECAQKTAEVIADARKANDVALLVDDRLDVVLAARARGINVDGIHVGQSDIPVDICRKLLGANSIVGLSAPAEEMIEYVKSSELSAVDYLGVGPLHPTDTKRDCGMDSAGNILTKSLADISKLATISPVPIVVGGGVKLADIPALARTGADGFFVVSAVCSADNPYKAACELVSAWRANSN
ncbi:MULTISPECIES: thiamine phosphate synthase [unclassified Adlercreutzia]|uniref:thiamine phosphate synthase n=1 Tax=unclassified Adlercreutzia TaxID=2636013 RepID=UPI0013EAF4D5|nr:MULTISPECIES: thiamine phosphate synthase [unclassified Adlercreutzia]